MAPTRVISTAPPEPIVDVVAKLVPDGAGTVELPGVANIVNGTVM
jgi:hypothetical protein